MSDITICAIGDLIITNCAIDGIPLLGLTDGHLECLFHLFAYLGKYQNAEMLYDPTEPHINLAAFQKQDWTFPL